MTDELLFDFSELYKYGRALTEIKRSVLKLTAKIFDPIGFLTPFTIEMKILFQELCLERVDWDGEFQGDLLKSWTLLLEELWCLNSVRIPRCYFQSTRNASYMVFVTPLIKHTPLLFIFQLFIPMEELAFVCSPPTVDLHHHHQFNLNSHKH